MDQKPCGAFGGRGGGLKFSIKNVLHRVLLMAALNSKFLPCEVLGIPSWKLSGWSLDAASQSKNRRSRLTGCLLE